MGCWEVCWEEMWEGEGEGAKCEEEEEDEELHFVAVERRSVIWSQLVVGY